MVCCVYSLESPHRAILMGALNIQSFHDEKRRKIPSLVSYSNVLMFAHYSYLRYIRKDCAFELSSFLVNFFSILRVRSEKKQTKYVFLC